MFVEAACRSLMPALFLSMQGAGNLPSKYVAADKDTKRAKNKRSHEDCTSQRVLAAGWTSCLLPHHTTVKGKNALSKRGKQCPQYTTAPHTYKGSLSERELSSNPFLTASKGDIEWAHMVFTCCSDTRPPKKALIVHEESQNPVQKYSQQAGKPLNGFDLKDQTLNPMSCSLTTLVAEKTIISQGNLHTSDQGQWCKQKSAQSNSRVLVDVTNKFQITATSDVKKQVEEDDVHRLRQRHKQIEFGKNTLGYERYLELVPKSKRKQKDPQTPKPKQVCSKRSWDGQIRQWRRLLHKYDPPVEDGEELPEDFAMLKSNQKETTSKNTPPFKEYTTSKNTQPYRSTLGNTTERVAKEDVELAIYEDWMDC